MKYSIIIPHKNCVDLLLRCINSIPNRLDVEVIVVDDNSSKESKCELGKISKENLEIIYTESGKGAGYARNVGLLSAKGEWIFFADADDYFSENAFEVFDSVASNLYDIIYFKHRSVFSDTGETCERFNIRNALIDNYINNNIFDNLVNLKYKDVVPWAKLFKRILIDSKHQLFDEVPASNDVTFVSHMAYYANNILVSELPIYICTYRKGSITRTDSRENMYSRYVVSLKYSRFMDEINHKRLRPRIISRIINAWRHYGWLEAKKYIDTAKQYNVNIFTNMGFTIKEIVGKLAIMLDRSKYAG